MTTASGRGVNACVIAKASYGPDGYDRSLLSLLVSGVRVRAAERSRRRQWLRHDGAYVAAVLRGARAREGGADTTRVKRYWLTPPELDALREGRWDPCPYPHGWGDPNALLIPWKKPWYLNPPFGTATRFVRKAIQEGGPGVIIIPVTAPTYLLLEAGAELTALGRVQWLEVETGERMRNGVLCAKAVLP